MNKKNRCTDTNEGDELTALENLIFFTVVVLCFAISVYGVMLLIEYVPKWYFSFIS